MPICCQQNWATISYNWNLLLLAFNASLHFGRTKKNLVKDECMCLYPDSSIKIDYDFILWVPWTFAKELVAFRTGHEEWVFSNIHDWWVQRILPSHVLCVFINHLDLCDWLDDIMIPLRPSCLFHEWLWSDSVHRHLLGELVEVRRPLCCVAEENRNSLWDYKNVLRTGI